MSIWPFQTPVMRFGIGRIRAECINFVFIYIFRRALKMGIIIIIHHSEYDAWTMNICHHDIYWLGCNIVRRKHCALAPTKWPRNADKSLFRFSFVPMKRTRGFSRSARNVQFTRANVGPNRTIAYGDMTNE